MSKQFPTHVKAVSITHHDDLIEMLEIESFDHVDGSADLPEVEEPDRHRPQISLFRRKDQPVVCGQELLRAVPGADFMKTFRPKFTDKT
jgi:hypothetical protein